MSFLPIHLPLDSRFEQNHVLTLPCSHPNFSSPIGQVNLYQGSYLVPIPLPPSPSAVFFSISTFITYFYYLVFNTALPAHPGSWCLGDCPSPCSRSEAAWAPTGMVSSLTGDQTLPDEAEHPHRSRPWVSMERGPGTLNCQNPRRGTPQFPSANSLENESLMNFLWQRRVTWNK